MTSYVKGAKSMNKIEIDLGEVSVAFNPQKPKVIKVLLYQENYLKTKGDY